MDTEPQLRPTPPPLPGDADLVLARRYLSHGKIVQAKAALRSAVAADPDNREAIRLLLTVDQAGSSTWSAARTTLRLQSRRVAQILFVVALFFLCSSLRYLILAQEAGPNGTVSTYVRGVGTRQMTRQDVLPYVTVTTLCAFAAAGAGFYVYRAKERLLQQS